MTPIITDQSALRQISKPAVIENCTLNADGLRVVQELISSIPDHGAGLSAPQIGEFCRIFLARLSNGHFIFVNPSFCDANDSKTPSVEGCLSIPNVTWCVNRHHSITIKSELVFVIKDNKIVDTILGMTLPVCATDSYIVQHEYDHLEGVLMIDHPRTETVDEKLARQLEDRRKRIEAKRMAKNIAQNKKDTRLQKVSAKKSAKINKFEKAARRQEKKRVEMQEKIIADQAGLFSDQ